MVHMSSDSQTTLPTVAVVTLNYNGKEHLEACFESLRALDYPRDRYRIVCVDNASADGSPDFVRARFPDVRLIESGGNLGFAGGCNLGARESEAEYIAFVNNDARVDPGWLRALVAAIHGDPETVCASAKILDWEGETVDFVGGHLNFHGFARQPHWRAEVEEGLYDQPGPLLFACGGAMLIRRDVFLEVGGFDDDYFMFFEDVDLGWRLWLLGYRVVFVPEAVIYHRHHGSAGKLTSYRRYFLYERNALWTIIKNYDQANLDRILPAAILLAVHRATDHLQRAAEGADDLAPENWNALDAIELNRKISYGDLAPIVALRDVAAQMPALLAKRAAVQTRRRRPDAEILPLFGQPLRVYPVAHLIVQAYCDDHNQLLRAFGIDAIFRHVKTRVLILTTVGLPSLGFAPTPEGLRADALGEGLRALGHNVVHSLPRHLVERHDRPVPSQIERHAWTDGDVDSRVLYGPDVVVVTHWRALAFLRLSIYRPVVLDYNPAEPELSDEVPVVRDVILKKDYLVNVDLFTAKDEASLAAFARWLERAAKLAVDPAHLRVVPAAVAADGRVSGIEPLDDFCQNAWVSADKLPVNFRPQVPRTPLLELPARAWESYQLKGRGRLGHDIRKYVTWRVHLIRRYFRI